MAENAWTAEQTAHLEQLVLDENALAEGEAYLDLGVNEVSPDGRLLLVVDDTGPEFRVAELPVAAIDGGDSSASWNEVIADRPEVRVVAAAAFADHVVEYDVTSVRLSREGWVRPATEADHDLATGSETVVHVQQVLVRPEADDYCCELVHARADDGTQIPLSLVSRADVPRGTPQPCLLYGYGSYEASLDPEPWYKMRPLLDRGYVFAVAHPRGGGEGGRNWWLQGRLTSKRNTFTDFIACARHLIDAGHTRPDLLAARGGSAGGLLVGATAFMAPELFAAIVAEVPFVDVVTSMLDDTLPLTVGERDEWGDPRNPEHYEYMRSYSPCDNLPGPRRPALLVTASRHDPRVSVHEPAKWVAKMRRQEVTAGESDRRPLLLQTAMGAAAHTGPAGRYDAWRHEASMHAFVIDMLTPEDRPACSALTRRSAAGDGQLR